MGKVKYKEMIKNKSLEDFDEFSFLEKVNEDEDNDNTY